MFDRMRGAYRRPSQLIATAGKGPYWADDGVYFLKQNPGHDGGFMGALSFLNDLAIGS
jgi:hypothetical protein